MTTTPISDAYVFPQGPGTGAYAVGNEDDALDGAALSLLAEHSGGEYVRSGMDFTRDDANNQIDVSAGFAYIKDDASSTANQRSAGGQPQVQSAQSASYNTETPADQYYLVILPTTASVGVTDATASDIWLNITGVNSNNAVELRSSSGGGTTAAPSDTFLKLGTISDSGSGQATRSNDRKGDPSKILLATKTANNDTTIEFTSGITESFSRYVFELNSVVLNTDQQNISLRVSSDGGATFDSGASDYGYHNNVFDMNGANNKTTTNGDDAIQISGGGTERPGNASGESSNHTVWMHDPADASLQTLFKYSHAGIASDGAVVQLDGGGARLTASAVNGVQFKTQQGNGFASGTFKLYGVVG